MVALKWAAVWFPTAINTFFSVHWVSPLPPFANDSDHSCKYTLPQLLCSNSSSCLLAHAWQAGSRVLLQPLGRYWWVPRCFPCCWKVQVPSADDGGSSKAELDQQEKELNTIWGFVSSSTSLKGMDHNDPIPTHLSWYREIFFRWNLLQKGFY